MWHLLKLGVFIFAGLVISSTAVSEQLIYSHQFENKVAYLSGTAQYEDWLSYRASLPASDITSITISGSLDSAGRTCSDPAMAQQIADAMIAGASGLSLGTRTLSLSCDGFMWNVGSCSSDKTDANNLELNVGPLVDMCGCNYFNYTLRPGISGGVANNSGWGGIAGRTCGAPTQTMALAVTLATDTDTDDDGTAKVIDAIARLCPCDGPLGGTNSWKNHGKYMSCTAHAAKTFVNNGLITEEEKDAMMLDAGESSCGRK